MTRITFTADEQHERIISDAEESREGVESTSGVVRDLIEDAAALQSVEEDLQHAREQVDELEQQRDELQEDLEEQRDRVDELRAQLADVQEERDELRERVADLREDRETMIELRGRVEELEDSLAHERGERARAEEDARRAEARLELHDDETDDESGFLSRLLGR